MEERRVSESDGESRWVSWDTVYVEKGEAVKLQANQSHRASPYRNGLMVVVSTDHGPNRPVTAVTAVTAVPVAEPLDAPPMEPEEGGGRWPLLMRRSR
jgi:hypothetical protein